MLMMLLMITNVTMLLVLMMRLLELFTRVIRSQVFSVNKYNDEVGMTMAEMTMIMTITMMMMMMMNLLVGRLSGKRGSSLLRIRPLCS